MRDALSRRLPPAIAAAALVYLFAPLARPHSVLAVRDVPVFHLPLRTALAAAAAEGVPAWNPWIHGGQPILSNPNYAAFYPPTWLTLALAPGTALQLLLLLHVAFGACGAWKFARRLGCEAPAAAFAAFAFGAGGTQVAAVNLVTTLCCISWAPWLLRWADEWFEDDAGGPLRGPGRLAGGFALQFLAGEPMVVAATGCAVACLACRHPRRAPRRVGRLAAAAGLALALASIQLLPTLHRLADSPRAEGLGAEEFTTWSAPPQRLVEWVFPRFYGDPMRGDENLYFGWGVHDQDYPYLLGIYPGLPVLLLALAALARWPIPRRRAWILIAVVGLLLALGRHNPLFAAAGELLPSLRFFRYPEKFLLMTGIAFAFAAALGWQHLLEERRRGNFGAADFPAALAALVAAVSVAGTALLAVRADLGGWFITRHTVVPLSDDGLAAGLAFLRRGAVTASLTAGATLLLFLAHRARRPPAAILTIATLSLVATDLAIPGRALLPTVALPQLLESGRPGRELTGADRIYVDLSARRYRNLTLRDDRPGPAVLWNAVGRLDPYLANLWRLPYVLHEDTDRMLTGWARYALDTLDTVRAQPAVARRLIGAWSADRIVRAKPLPELLRGRYQGEPVAATRIEPNPDYLPRLRFTPTVTFHPTPESAVAASIQGGFDLRRGEHWIDPARAGSRVRSAADTRSRETSIGFRTLRLAYRAGAPTYLVAAVTYDRGWRARVDGSAVPVHATAAGQVGVELPAGDHRVELTYWDRWVTAGAAVTLLSLLAVLVYSCRAHLLARARLRRRSRSGSR